MKFTHTRLPEPVVAGLSDSQIDQGQATLLFSVDTDGFPRVSMVSNAEIYVVDDRHVRVALWRESRTVSNIRRTRSMTLFRIDEGVPYSIRVECDSPVELKVPGRPLVAISGRIVAVDGDSVDYASMVGFSTFKLLDPAVVLPVWSAIGRALTEV